MSAIEVTPTEVIDLHADEEIIERGLQSFVEVGQALRRIRDERKYKASGFSTFEEYCQQRWGMSRPYAYQLIDGSTVAVGMSAIADIPPRSESQVRPLVSLAKKDAALATEAWTLAVEAAEGEQPTAKQVKAAVEKVAPRPETGKPQSETKPQGNDGDKGDEGGEAALGYDAWCEKYGNAPLDHGRPPVPLDRAEVPEPGHEPVVVVDEDGKVGTLSSKGADFSWYDKAHRVKGALTGLIRNPPTVADVQYLRDEISEALTIIDSYLKEHGT